MQHWTWTLLQWSPTSVRPFLRLTQPHRVCCLLLGGWVGRGVGGGHWRRFSVLKCVTCVFVVRVLRGMWETKLIDFVCLFYQWAVFALLQSPKYSENSFLDRVRAWGRGLFCCSSSPTRFVGSPLLVLLFSCWSAFGLLPCSDAHWRIWDFCSCPKKKLLWRCLILVVTLLLYFCLFSFFVVYF